jgi:hypothetical protein
LGIRRKFLFQVQERTVGQRLYIRSKFLFQRREDKWQRLDIRRKFCYR